MKSRSVLPSSPPSPSTPLSQTRPAPGRSTLLAQGFAPRPRQLLLRRDIPIQDSAPNVAELVAVRWTNAIASEPASERLLRQIAPALARLLLDEHAAAEADVDGHTLSSHRLAGTREQPELIYLQISPQPGEHTSPLGTQWLTLRFVDGNNPCSGGDGDVPRLELSGADWNNWDLRGLVAPRLTLHNADLTRTCLDGADLSEWRMQGGLASGIALIDAQLPGAQLEHLCLYEARLDRSRCDGARFDGCDLGLASLDGAVLDGARFTHCSLIGTQGLGALDTTVLERCVVSPSTGLAPGLTPACLRRPGDTIQRGDTVIFSEPAPPFVHTFVAHMRERGVNAILVRSASSRWMRDVCFKAGLDRGPNATFRLLRLPDNIHSLRETSVWASEHRHHGSFPRTAPGEPMPPMRVPPLAIEPSFSPFQVTGLVLPPAGGPPIEIEAFGGFESDEQTFIPGGNLIVVRPDLCVMGSDDVPYTVDPARLPPLDSAAPDKATLSYPRVEDPALRTALWQARKRTKQEIRELLGVSKLVVVPQWAFHIDLQMAFLGNNRMLVHSFAETVNFIETHFDELAVELGGIEGALHLLERNRGLALRLEEAVVDTACHKLRQAGMGVVKACAMLIGSVSNRQVPTQIRTLFTNGVVMDDGDGQHFTFYTADAPGMDTHKRRFSAVCERLDVRVVYMDSLNGASPMDFIEQKMGGLRCLTNTNVLACIDHVPHSGAGTGTTGLPPASNVDALPV